jgi:hypothetical protein
VLDTELDSQQPYPRALGQGGLHSTIVRYPGPASHSTRTRSRRCWGHAGCTSGAHAPRPVPAAVIQPSRNPFLPYGAMTGRFCLCGALG